MTQIDRFICILAVVYYFTTFVQAHGYKSGEIGNKSVILLDQHEMIVKNKKKAIYKHHRIIRIPSPAHNDDGEVVLTENNYVEITSLRGSLRDEQGKIIKKLGKKDQLISTLTPGYILYADTKTTLFKMESQVYPYLLDYEVEYELSSLFYWPDWYPQADLPVIKSTYKVILQEPVNFKYYAADSVLVPIRTVEDGDSVYFWQLDSLPARTNEDFMSPTEMRRGSVLFAPLDFLVDDYSGSNETWNSFGNWYLKLVADRYHLSPLAVQVVDSIRQANQSSSELIKSLYAYLQSRTRYVAISLGIGGFQPHSAATVFENCYGDCKDLTTLMVAMLRYAGIAAYPALTLTRDEGTVIKEFPSNQFNHVITCVPMDGDTTWLETTAEYLAAGEIPWEIDGCNVLLVKENESKLVRTRQSLSSDNRWCGKIQGFLTTNGSMDFTAQLHLSGNQKQDIWQRWMSSKPSEFKEWFIRTIGKYGLNPDITGLEARQEFCSERLETILDFKGKLRNTGVFSSTRLFLNPNILNRRTVASLPEKRERKFPVELNYPYIDQDSLAIRLPFGYELENAPKSVNLETEFASYTTDYSFLDGVFYYSRRFEFRTRTIAAELYPQYVDFLKAVAVNDQAKFVFKK